jgi:hypothetical protein
VLTTNLRLENTYFVICILTMDDEGSLLETWPVLVSDLLLGHYPEAEHTAVGLMVSVQNIFLWEPEIQNCPEKPPTNNQEDSRRRVDMITYYLKQPQHDWKWHVGAVWEVKKKHAGPADVTTCETQLLDACNRLFAATTGSCFAFAVIGNKWRAYKYTMPTVGGLGTFTCLIRNPDHTGNLDAYMDIGDTDEGPVINSIVRDLREDMG